MFWSYRFHKRYKSNTFCGKTTHNIPLKQPLLTVCHNSVSPTLIIQSPDFDNSHEGGPGWLPQWERAQVYNKCLSSPGHWLTAVITLVHWAPKHGGTLQGVWAIGHCWSNEEQHFVLTGSIMMWSVYRLTLGFVWIKTIILFKSSWNDWLKDEKLVFDNPFDGLHLRGSLILKYHNENNMHPFLSSQNSCEMLSQFNHTGHVGIFSLW